MIELSGNIVDVVNRDIFYGILMISNGRIRSVVRVDTVKKDKNYILPGFIDAHVHIESSMLVPSEFARLAVKHGTVASVSDPHEIGNVLGYEGVKYMIENGRRVPFKFHFGAPSCVPATAFETAGDVLSVDDIERLFSDEGVSYLAEMMNWPGVLARDSEVWQKIELAHRYHLPIDGHAPGLMGEQAKKYFEAGISTDHECFIYEEAFQKAALGVKIIIREGSAAKNFETLIPLIRHFPANIMFCSDDKHPDDLALGHINQLVARAVEYGYDLFDVLCAATLNPVVHYRLSVGLLRENDPADLIVVPDLIHFTPLATYIDGQKVMEASNCLFEKIPVEIVNRFEAHTINTSDIIVQANDSQQVRVIEAVDGQLITRAGTHVLHAHEGMLSSDVENDVLKLVVLNRYQPAKPAVAYIRGFGFKCGAIASSVAHDSHNIIAVGVDDADIVAAINMVVGSRGGLSIANGSHQNLLALPIAGLMSNEPGEVVAARYTDMYNYTRDVMKCDLKSPFMLISFMALLVIPELKLSDKGLFDGVHFQFTDVIA